MNIMNVDNSNELPKEVWEKCVGCMLNLEDEVKSKQEQFLYQHLEFVMLHKLVKVYNSLS